jgi:hypothetical protein
MVLRIEPEMISRTTEKLNAKTTKASNTSSKVNPAAVGRYDGRCPRSATI